MSKHKVYRFGAVIPGTVGIQVKGRKATLIHHDGKRVTPLKVTSTRESGLAEFLAMAEKLEWDETLSRLSWETRTMNEVP